MTKKRIIKVVKRNGIDWIDIEIDLDECIDSGVYETTDSLNWKVFAFYKEVDQ